MKLLLQEVFRPIRVCGTRLTRLVMQKNWNVYIPEIQYATDNAAMIAITGYYKYLKRQFSSHHITPVARFDHL